MTNSTELMGLIVGELTEVARLLADKVIPNWTPETTIHYMSKYPASPNYVIWFTHAEDDAPRPKPISVEWFNEAMVENYPDFASSISDRLDELAAMEEPIEDVAAEPLRLVA